MTHLMNAFRANGYPRHVITSTLGRRKPPQWDQDEQDEQEEQEKPKVLCLPYVKDTSETIERECI